MSNIITELTIKRSMWLRGEGDDKSYLYRTFDGKMCCLGQFALACGLSKEAMADKQIPRMLKQQCPSQLNVNSDGYDSLLNALMRYNDTRTMDDSTREVKIVALMSTLTPPVKVTFVD